jgi:hypothetical protein
MDVRADIKERRLVGKDRNRVLQYILTSDCYERSGSLKDGEFLD